jgi:hypothetical protein
MGSNYNGEVWRDTIHIGLSPWGRWCWRRVHLDVHRSRLDEKSSMPSSVNHRLVIVNGLACKGLVSEPSRALWVWAGDWVTRSSVEWRWANREIADDSNWAIGFPAVQDVIRKNIQEA